MVPAWGKGGICFHYYLLTFPHHQHHHTLAKQTLQESMSVVYLLQLAAEESYTRIIKYHRVFISKQSFPETMTHIH